MGGWGIAFLEHKQQKQQRRKHIANIYRFFCCCLEDTSHSLTAVTLCIHVCVSIDVRHVCVVFLCIYKQGLFKNETI